MADTRDTTTKEPLAGKSPELPKDQPPSATPVDTVTIPGPWSDPVPILRWVNPSLIRAWVDVSDGLRPDIGPFGEGDREYVRVVVRFSPIGGKDAPVRFDPAAVVYCDLDGAPSAILSYRDGAYAGEVSKGRVYPDGRPNFYYCRARIGDVTYDVARVPVAGEVTIASPTNQQWQFADEPVVVGVRCDAWSGLWSAVNPRLQIEHHETFGLTEVSKVAPERVIVERTVGGGGRSNTIEVPVPPVLPYAAPGSSGRVFVFSRLLSTHVTIGPSHFALEEWSSTTHASPVTVRWRL